MHGGRMDESISGQPVAQRLPGGGVRRRLMLGFGAVLVLLAMSSILTVIHSAWLVEKTDQLYQHPFVVSVAIRRVEGETVKIRLAMRELVLAENDAEVERTVAEVEEREKLIDENLRIIRSQYLGNVKDVELLEKDLAKWKILRADIIELRRQGRAVEAVGATRHEGLAQYEQVEKEVAIIADFAKAKAESFLAQAREISRNMVIGTIVLGGVVMCLGVAIALMTSRSLTKSMEQFRAAFEQAAVGMAHVGIDGRWLMVNRKLCDILGYGAEDLKTRSFQDLTHPADLEEGVLNFSRLKQGEFATFSMEKRYVHKLGFTVWVSMTVSLIRDAQGNALYAFAVVQDISERKKVEGKLEKAQSYIKNLIDSMPSTVIGVDPKGLVTHFNQTASLELTRPPENAVGDTLEHVFPAYATQLESIRQAICDRKPILLEKQPRAEKGEIHFQDVLIYPLVANGVDGAVLRIDDVTERVRLAEMMVQTEKMMSVGGLAAGMAHEINNPLGAILQSAQVILLHMDPANEKNRKVAQECGCKLEDIREYLVRRKIPEFLEGIREAGARAARIVANMLDFSRRSDSSKGIISVAELLDRSVELASTDYDLKKKYDFRHIRIVKDYGSDVPPVFCSRTEIEQVVLNLLKNAAQAMAAKHYEGQDQKPTVTLRTARNSDKVAITVEDNGPGMEEPVRRRVFEPFFTTKETGQGTGLGLSVSYFIISTNHGGTISVESWPGEGTRFVIELPAYKDEEEAVL